MDDIVGATSTDTPRPVATAGNNDFTLSIEQVSERYAPAGHPRTIRTLQRYCASGHLDAQKIATTLAGTPYIVVFELWSKPAAVVITAVVHGARNR